MLLDPNSVSAKPAESPISDVTAATFEAEVLRASLQTPIVVDFWAPWCGPCKQLMPILEKVITSYGGKVRLAKVNIDQNPEIAQALRVQSVPTVYIFFGGQPVDGFTGAIPESDIRRLLDGILKKVGAASPAAALEAVLTEADRMLNEGEAKSAIPALMDILAAAPDNIPAQGLLARALLVSGDAGGAEAVLARIPEKDAGHPAVAAARASLELAKKAESAGPLRNLEQKMAQNPTDQQARIDFAIALFSAGRQEAAVDTLLESLKLDRVWNEGAARKQLVTFFEAMGPENPLTVSARKRLSSLLFA